MLSVNLKEKGESYYRHQLKDVVDGLLKSDLAVYSDGAVCVFMEDETIPFMIQKSDKGYNYSTTDLAALHYRLTITKSKKILYLTDLGQQLHFRQLFKVANMAGWINSDVSVKHVPFGLVLREDKKKFRTRSGENINLRSLLDQAVNQAELIMKEKNTENNNIKKCAFILGISAVKYADLSCPRQSDYMFSFDKMLSFDGNTSCFVNYSYVRMISIVEKYIHSKKNIKWSIFHKSERDLIFQCCKFNDVLNDMEKHLMPNKMTDYIFKLSQAFNAFYRDCPIIGSDQESQRISILQATKLIIETACGILGIKLLNKM